MRLSTRLLLPLLATVALVMAGYGLWALRQRENTLSSEARRETTAYATALGIALEQAFRDRDRREVQSIIDRISREPTIYGVLVYDRDGGLLFLSDPLRAGTPAAPDSVVREVLRAGEPRSIERTLGEQRVFSVLRPIADPAGATAGAFEVVQPLAFVEAEKGRTRQRFLLNTLTLLAAVTVLILWLVRRHVGRPLSGLVSAAQALGRGELGHRIAVPRTGGELSELAEEFNRMSASLESARAELVREAEERVTLERRLRESEKMAAVGNLATGLAHEIAAPLHVIRGRSDLLRKRPADRETSERQLRIITEQIDRITHIVRGLLDFARRREPRLERLDARAVIADVLELVEAELEAGGIAVAQRLEGELWLEADPNLLHRLFLNLVLNAIHALHEVPAHERRLVVSAEPPDPDGLLAITIEDSGPGIDPDALPRIFEPFFTTKAGGQGTGLGLAIAASIAEEHGGRIEVVSPARPERPGGALFRVRLPAAPAAAPVHA